MLLVKHFLGGGGGDGGVESETNIVLIVNDRARQVRYKLTTLLLRYTNSASPATSGLCVLSTNTHTQIVADTTVSPI